MNLRSTYLSLALLGTVLPYWQLVGFLVENGLDVPQLVSQAAATRISGFAWLDVLVSGVVVIVLVLSLRDRLGTRWWWPIAGLSVGVSLALPLCLYLLESQKTRKDYGE